MANRFYTDNSQRKVSETAPRPSPSLGSSGKHQSIPETQPPYNADIGPGGPDMNRGANFPKVKVYMKSKMSPEMGSGMPEMLPSVQPMAQPSYVSNEGINASSQNQMADAARQQTFRRN
jgi:hypothetical protein